MSFQDILAPKRFIYKYLEELLGKSTYQELYKEQAKHAPNASSLTWAEWQENVLANTVFGRELRQQSAEKGFPKQFQAEHDWNPSDLQHQLGLCWINHVLSRIEGLGVTVTVKI